MQVHLIYFIPITIYLMKAGNGSITWLLGGDISIAYQAYRDLLGSERPALQTQIEYEGWGARFLSYRMDNGHWGRSFYQPKWTSTHYTLLDLKNLNISSKCIPVRDTIALILAEEKGSDGGINPSGTIMNSDVCINGMALNYCSYFQADKNSLKSIVDFILTQHMPDGGFNCRYNRSGAIHSSLHSTLSVIEGIHEYDANGYSYRLPALKKAERSSQEFILQHRLFKSDKTGEVIDEKMLRLPYPARWRYDILRALDYFQFAQFPYDDRMNDAIEILLEKRGKDGKWKLNAPYPGETHFNMETAGHQSRWNTLRALRVLKHFNISH